METPDFFKNLSEDDIGILMGMYEKMLNTQFDPEKLAEEAENDQEGQYSEIFESEQPLLDCPVEIVFHVTCNVLNKNQKGELINSEKVIMKNYHAALDNKSQVERYVEGFFNKFHQKMEEQANETIPEPNNE